MPETQETGRKDGNAPCGNCGKLVLETDAAVGCDGSCKEWYHKDCAGISAGDFATLKKQSTTLLWMCKGCKEDLVVMKSGKEELKGIWSELKNLKEAMKDIIVDEIKKVLPQQVIEQMNSKMNNMSDQLKKLATDAQYDVKVASQALVQSSNSTRQSLAHSVQDLSKTRTSQENKGKVMSQSVNNQGPMINKHEMEKTREAQDCYEVAEAQSDQVDLNNTSDAHSISVAYGPSFGMDGFKEVRYKRSNKYKKYHRQESEDTDSVEDSQAEEYADNNANKVHANQTRRDFIKPKTRLRQDTIVGSKKVTNEARALRAGDKMIWRYVGKLHKDTDRSDLVRYLECHINGEIVCEELKSVGINKAFKVGIRAEESPKVDRSDFWPERVVIRPFRFPWRRDNEGAKLF